MARAQRTQRTQDTTAVGEAFTRAAHLEEAKLPARFTVSDSPGSRHGKMVTDTSTGRTSEVQAGFFGIVRRVLSELFPDD